MRFSALVTVILFGIVGGYFLVRLIADRTAVDRVFNASHLLMAVSMIIMGFSWSVRIPASVQLITFSGFALWYVYRAMFHPGVHHHRRRKLIYHAAMMLAMAWMAVIMAPAPTGTGGHHHGGNTSGSVPLHPWADPLSTIIAAGFAAATLWYLAQFIRIAGTPAGAAIIDRRALADSAASAAMAAGMAIAFSWEM